MKQFAVVGVGLFGAYLATHLYEKGHEVLAVDSNPARVQAVKDRVTRAAVADGTDRAVLEALGAGGMDAAVVCIGADMGHSILTTLNLKEIGVKRVLARATTEAHGRILKRIGADEVFFPEKDLALSLGERLHNPNLLDYLPLITGYGIVEITPPEEFAGKTLRELDLTNRYGIQVIAVKKTVPKDVLMAPKALYRVESGDLLILLGPDDSLGELQARET